MASRRNKPEFMCSIGPTPEQMSKSVYEPVRVDLIDPSEQPIGLAYRNRTPAALDKLFHKSLIDERQFQSGSLFRKHWELSGQQQSVTAAYAEPSGVKQNSYGMASTERQAHYRQIWRDACGALLDGKYANMAIDVICMDLPAAAIGDGSKPSLTGMTKLRFILDILASHYRM